MEFGAVGFKVVEFPGAGAALADEFEVADADGCVALVFPKESVSFDGVVCEGGDEAFAFHGQDGFAVELLRVVGATDIDTGGHDVDEVAGLGAKFIFGGDA